jgi:hypothetical protein
MKKISGLLFLGFLALGLGYTVGVKNQVPAVTPDNEAVVITEAGEITSRATSSAVTSRIDIGPLGTDEVRVIHQETIRWNPREEK